MNYNIYLTIFIVALLFYFIIHPIINFYDWISWWNSTKCVAHNNTCYDCIDLYAMAFANQNYITYYIYNLFGAAVGKTNRFTNDGQIIFIQSLMMSLSTAVDGFLIPYNLCGSIVPDQLSGIGPWPTNVPGWKSLFMQWANISPNTVFNTLNDYHPDLNSWQNATGNFLYNTWGIGADSALVAGFITNLQANLTGNELYPQAMSQLLGVGSAAIPGGWFGFLKYTETSLTDLATIQNYIWTDEAIPEKIQDGTQKAQASKCNASLVGPIGSGVVSGVMLGAMLAPEAAMGPVGWVIGAVLGAIMIAGSVIPACS